MFAPLEPIYTVAGIRSIEERIMPEAEPPLMERAGRAAAEEAFRLTMARPGPVLIACGPGNNGGDGFVMARRLLQANRAVVVAFSGDPERLPPDARAAYDAWLDVGGDTVDAPPPTPDTGWALVADALFGIGLQRPINGHYAQWLDALNRQQAPRLALDIPSGLCANTGHALGPTFAATHTLTFIALKPGLLTLDGPDYAGQVIIRNLDIDPTACQPAEAYKLRPALFRAHLIPRRLNSHKGLYGNAAIIGGAPGMTGAALLAGRAALKLGAGRVLLGLLDGHAREVDPTHPEMMMRDPDALMEEASVIAAGPGLGVAPEAQRLTDALVNTEHPLVLDADALNILARRGEIGQACADRTAAVIMTPHPGEAARLLDTDTESVQRDRVFAATEISRRFNAWVALKGCGTVMSTPDGRWYINTTGNAGMATAGMGDTLTGLITGLLAQHWEPEMAMITGVHLHGTAAELLASEHVGPVGLTAGEVIETARRVFNEWIQQAGNPPPLHP